LETCHGRRDVGKGVAEPCGPPLYYEENPLAEQLHDPAADKLLFDEAVDRLLPLVAWRLTDMKQHELVELLRGLQEHLSPAERAATSRVWARRRRDQAVKVTDPADRESHGLIELARAIVDRLDRRGFRVFHSEPGLNMTARLAGDDWRHSELGREVEAVQAAAAGAKEVALGLLRAGQPPAFGELRALVEASLPADWDELLRGAVTDAALAAAQAHLVTEADDAGACRPPVEGPPADAPGGQQRAGGPAEQESGTSAADSGDPGEEAVSGLLPGAQQVVELPVGGLRLHEEAGKIPFMREVEWEPFLEDVRAHGVQDPLMVQKGGVVLNGRCRLRAARECGLPSVPAVVVDLTPEEQLEAIYRSALLRRHLSDDQRAVLAARYQELLSQGARRERARKAGLAGGRGRAREGDSLRDTAPRKPGGRLTMGKGDGHQAEYSAGQPAARPGLRGAAGQGQRGHGLPRGRTEVRPGPPRPEPRGTLAGGQVPPRPHGHQAGGVGGSVYG
jgi:hypothetical protein